LDYGRRPGLQYNRARPPFENKILCGHFRFLIELNEAIPEYPTLHVGFISSSNARSSEITVFKFIIYNVYNI